jgi:hypothetical protein
MIVVGIRKMVFLSPENVNNKQAFQVFSFQKNKAEQPGDIVEK